MYHNENGIGIVVHFDDQDHEMVDLRLSHQIVTRESISPAISGGFLDASMYTERGVDYGRWSLKNHVAVIDHILSKIPIDEKIIVPGDGPGLVASRRSNVIAGDIAITNITHPEVRKETFVETIQRGLAAGATTIILSYIYDFLDPIVLEYILSLRIKTYICDIANRVPDSRFVIVGYGITTNDSIFVLPVGESRDVSSLSIAYPENLLRVDDQAIFLSINPAMQYLHSMQRRIVRVPRVLEEAVKSAGMQYEVVPITPDSLILAYSLAEYRMYPFNPVYLVSIGQLVEVRPFPSTPGQSLFESRVVYSGIGPYISSVSQHFGSYVDGQTLYFYCPSEQRTITINYADGQRTLMNYDIHFVRQIERKTPLIPVMSNYYMFIIDAEKKICSYYFEDLLAWYPSSRISLLKWLSNRSSYRLLHDMLKDCTFESLIKWKNSRWNHVKRSGATVLYLRDPRIEKRYKTLGLPGF